MTNMDSLTQQVHQLCKSKSYVSKKTLKVLCVTFNVNAKVEYDMNTIFPFVTNRECNSYRPEIVIIGLQEVVELSATNVVGSKVLGDNETIVETWRKSIETYLNKGVRNYNYIYIYIFIVPIYNRYIIFFSSMLSLNVSKRCNLIFRL